MINKFLSAINDFSMINRGDSICVGVSGGADSMCLIDMLFNHKNDLGISICVAHINHCLRGSESDSDELFVREYCNKKNIQFYSLRADISSLSEKSGESTELCARKVRYEFFNSLDCDKIATAHTASDVAETMLMNLSRGSTLNGLCSIPPVRENIIRPLIYFTREDTESYCRENRINFVTDSTNLSDDYTRNKFRHNVVSNLKNINPSFEANVLRCISSLRCDNDFIEKYSEEVFGKVVFDNKKLDLIKLGNYHEAVRKRVYALFIAKYCNSDFEKIHIDLIDKNRLSENYSLILPGNFKLDIKKGVLGFSEIKEIKKISEISLNKNSLSEADFDYHGLHLSVSDKRHLLSEEYAVDFYKIDDIITIRSRTEGDYINLAKRHCKKSLKKLFNEMKIPVEKRCIIPVVCDKSGVIFCSAGGVDAERCVDNNTEKILIIKTEDVKNV